MARWGVVDWPELKQLGKMKTDLTKERKTIILPILGVRVKSIMVLSTWCYSNPFLCVRDRVCVRMKGKKCNRKQPRKKERKNEWKKEREKERRKKKQTNKKNRQEWSSSIKFFSLWIVTRLFVKTTTTTATITTTLALVLCAIAGF